MRKVDSQDSAGDSDSEGKSNAELKINVNLPFYKESKFAGGYSMTWTIMKQLSRSLSTELRASSFPICEPQQLCVCDIVHKPSLVRHPSGDLWLLWHCDNIIRSQDNKLLRMKLHEAWRQGELGFLSFPISESFYSESAVTRHMAFGQWQWPKLVACPWLAGSEKPSVGDSYWMWKFFKNGQLGWPKFLACPLDACRCQNLITRHTLDRIEQNDTVCRPQI